VSELPGSPRASRLGSPSWLDGRLVLGVLLVLVSVLVGAKVLAGADTSQQVWVATHDLAPGTVVAEGDLRTGQVRLFGSSSGYLAGGKPVGYLVTRDVGAGELLPRASLQQPPGSALLRRDITLSVATGHLPPDLAHGQQVDVYVTPDDKAAKRSATAAGDAYAPRLVLAGLALSKVVRAGGLGASGQDQPVVLSVEPGQVLALVQAMSEGSLDLVRVPAGASRPLAAPTS
jgi:hypothetical protein